MFNRQTSLTEEQIDILYRNLFPVISGTIAAILMVTWVVYDVLSRGVLLIWLGSALLVVLMRLAVYFSYQRPHTKTSKSPVFWQYLFLAGVILSGLWWGISGWYFLPIVPMHVKLMIVLIYGGLLAGSTLAYCYMQLAFYLYTALLIIPMLVCLLSAGQFETQVGFFLCVYTFFLCVFYHRLVNELTSAMELEYKLESLETELEHERQDVSVRRHRYASIENRYQQLVDNASDLIFRTDEKGNYIYVNHECVNVTGFTQEELLQKNYLDLIHPGHQQRVKRAMYRLYTGRKDASANVDFPVVTASGATLWISQSTQMIKFGDDYGYEFQGIARDISQEKNRGELLEAARKKEAQALTVKNDFINNISHELRTPLHVISGSIELLEESGLDNFQHSQLKILTSSSNQMLALINDILDLSKIEKNQIELIHAPFSIKQLMSEVMLTFKQLAKEKKLNLSNSIDRRIPEKLVGDYYRLLQILVNLVSNAIKYTREGDVKVSLSLESRDDASVQLLFSVSDTGIGIQANDVDKIFDKFQQTRHGAALTRAGTGLGLAIVKSLIELQGGSLSVNSVVDKGSKFSFILSLDTASQTDNEALSDSGSHPVSTEGIPGRVARILIVDDNEMVKTVVISQMRQYWDKKVLVDSADNGLVAINQIEKNNYDLILMDLQMPIMDGTIATKKIRNMSSQKRNTIVIALSAASIMFNELIELGFDDSLPKPFTKTDLIKKVSYWLHQCSNNEELKEPLN